MIRSPTRERQPTEETAADSDLEIQPVEELGAARSEWMCLAERDGNVFGTWEWADAWWRHLGAGQQLALAVARRRGQAVAILPLFIAREQPFRLVRFIGAGPSDALGAVCAPAERHAAATALRSHAAAVLGRSGLFLAERLAPGDPFTGAPEAIQLRRSASPVLPTLERSFEEFLQSRSRNFRSQVRRRERALARGRKLTFRLTRDAETLDEDMRTLICLHAARWKGQSAAFGGRRALFHLEFARRALEKGWLRLWTMELDGAPVAAWYGLRYQGCETYYQAGRDPAFEELHVGFVLLCHSIRSAFDDGMREYRFGLGDEPYKHRFAQSDPGVNTVAIVAGKRGKLALSASQLALRMPRRLRLGAWQAGAGRREAV